MSSDSKAPVLFSYFRSSCAWRIRIALAMKNIYYEYKAINLLQKEQLSEEYRKLNPMGQVPAFVINGNTLTQTLSILEYLEEVYPEVQLLPKCPILKAKVREICSIIATGIQPLQNLSVLNRIGDEKKMQWAHDCIEYGFVALEQILSKCCGKYCVGNIVTLADCCIVPQVFNAGRFDVDMNAFPNIKRISQNLSELDAFKMAHPSKQPDCPDRLK